jgi:hypothetical protein
LGGILSAHARGSATASCVGSCAERSAPHEQVSVLTGDWSELLDQGPFDMLVLDGGGSGKTLDDGRVEPREVLRPGGSLVIDDWTPWEGWPPSEAGEFAHSRLHWLEHPDLLASEVRLSPTLSTIVAMRR